MDFFSAKPIVDMVRSCRLCVSDFETLEVIGRGAFGEVKVCSTSLCTPENILLVVWTFGTMYMYI